MGEGEVEGAEPQEGEGAEPQDAKAKRDAAGKAAADDLAKVFAEASAEQQQGVLLVVGWWNANRAAGNRRLGKALKGLQKAE